MTTDGAMKQGDLTDVSSWERAWGRGELRNRRSRLRSLLV